MATKQNYEVPGVAAISRQISFAIAADGDQNEYYLNEGLALAEWARQHGYASVRLPALRGSSQSISAKLVVSKSFHADCQELKRSYK
jgi:hypothetical protein